MRLPANPTQYKISYLAESHPPQPPNPSTVEWVQNAQLANNPCFVIEIKDIQLAIKQGINQNLFPDLTSTTIDKVLDKNPELGIIRYFIPIHQAKALAAHLIDALSRTDDKIAQKINETMKSTIKEAAKQAGEPDPYEEENQDNLQDLLDEAAKYHPKSDDDTEHESQV